MSEIKRYFPWRGAGMDEDPNGTHVKFKDHLDALGEAEERVRAKLAHHGEPDISVGDVIDAQPDGTITLDDGITTWNPSRASSFLVAQAERKAETELQTLRADIAYVRGHLKGYADAIRLRLRSGEDLAQVLKLLLDDLREDAARLEKLGGGD